MVDAQFVEEYSKRILAFAYNKTSNIYDAEDLSQEILISLLNSIERYSKIENINAFVYTICHHCWSNFLRKNKKYWNMADIDTTPNLFDDFNLQDEVETAILIEKMKIEIAYLSKLHRDIIVRFYYDGKSSRQISKELNISDSTIRWHLTEIRKKLKGRIENMNTENLIYKPVAFQAGWSGGNCNNMCGIGRYRLVDNICYVCYGEPLTVEEIARRLTVAASFIEPHVEELVYLDHLKVVDGNKYQTTFFIRTKKFNDAGMKYQYDNIKDKAEKLYETIEKRYDDIKAINFIGSDLDKDFLLWILIPLLVQRLEHKSNDIVNQKKEYFSCIPKRKDGSEHWIRVFLKEEDYVSTLPKEVLEFGKLMDWKASDAWAPNEICSYQLITYATQQICGDRPILWGRELQEIARIAEIVKNNLILSEHDKILIARYTEMGYVKMDGAKAKLMIPYLNKDEYEKLDKILLEIQNNLGNDFFVDYIEGCIKTLKSYIPDFLPDNEKNYAATGFGSCGASIPYYLADHGILRYPTDEEAKCMCVIIWEYK